MTRKSTIRSFRNVAGLTTVALLACASPNIAVGPQQVQAPSTNSSPSSPRSVSPNYRLGPDDEIVIYAPYWDESSNKRFRVEKSGEILLPSPVGRVRADSLTVDDLSEVIKKSLATIIKVPEAIVRVESPRSQPVTVVGKVNSPQEVQLEGGKTLLEVITKAGGFANDAGPIIRITRLMEYGPIPLSNAVNDDQLSVAEVSVASLNNLTRIEENIRLMPRDTIVVPRADIVWVIGGVVKPGGYALSERKTISLIDLWGQTGGNTPTAKVKNATIFRRLPDGSHTSIEVNIADALKLKPGKPELMLQAEDILNIPDSLMKGTLRRTFEQAVSSITGVAIYRPFY